MQGDAEAGGAGAEQGDDTWEFSGADLGGGDRGGQPAPGVAAAKGHAAADPAGAEVPARAEAAPLVEFLPPFEGIEPGAMQGNEQRALAILGRHAELHPPPGKKKRDLRDRRGRKRPAYIKRERAPGDHSFDPTPAQRSLVVALVGMKVPLGVICTLIGDYGIDEKTLGKHFGRELMFGREHFLANLKGMLVQAAQNGSVRAMTYMLDRLGGPDFAPRRANDDMADTPLTISASADVQIFLPDNRRVVND